MTIAAFAILYILGGILLGIAILVVGHSGGNASPMWFRITVAAIAWPLVTLGLIILVAIKGTR